MNISKIFILRPVATILLSLGLFIAGAVAYVFLPVAPLPNIDIPAIVVFANRPGADPATMANSIAAPLERRLGEIGGIDELNSINSTGASTIIAIFDFDKDIEDAAHEVQAAINAAQADLPSDLPLRPFYKKINPTDSPIITIAMASDTLSVGQVYEAADTVMAQRLSQVQGVSQVQIEGGQTPAVRVQLDPGALRAAGISSQDVLTAIRNANVLQPTGGFQGPVRAEEIRVNGQINRAIDYGRVVLKAKNGAVLRLSDVAHVVDGVTNTRLAAWHGTRPAIILNVSKVAGANVIQTVDRIRAVLPQLTKWISPEIHVTVLDDRTTTIRASTQDVQITLLITGALVLLTVLLFLRRVAATLAAAVTVPLSLAGTACGMWAMGFSLNNYSLMSITVSVGFVVDDAIVMIENITRLREQGMKPLQAAIVGSKQIGFTVISITLSLVAVFIPLLFMGSILGKIFHEFAFTLTIAILVSAAVSLTLTPHGVRAYRRQAADRSAGSYRCCHGERIPPHRDPLYPRPGLGTAASPRDAGSDVRDAGTDGLALWRGAQGVPHRAGYRPAARHDNRFFQRFVQRAEPVAAAGGRHHHEGPGGTNRQFQRRRQLRLRLAKSRQAGCGAETAHRTQRQCPAGDRAAAPATGTHRRHEDRAVRGAGRAWRRPQRRRRIRIPVAGRQSCRTDRLDQQGGRTVAA